MIQEKTSKLRDIRDTMSFGVEIFRQLRTPEVQYSVDRIRDASVTAKKIIEFLKTPEMVKNIENIRVISENINEASTKLQNAINQLDETGIIGETKGLIKSAKNATDSIMEKSQDMYKMSDNVKETFKSVRTLVKVLRIITVS